MSLADYQNRTVDILAFESSPSGDRLSLSSVFPGSTSDGFLCTGIQKLAQRWLLQFLTELGSVKYFPSRGCSFMTSFLSGDLHTELDVFQAFLLSRSELDNSLLAEEVGGEPDDERYSGCDLLRVTITEDQVSLTVSVVSRAGTARQVILPLASNG